MPIIYSKFFNLLKEKKISTYMIKQTGLVSQSSYQKMRTGTGHIDTQTIEKICFALECQPGDIMEYIPGKETEIKEDFE